MAQTQPVNLVTPALQRDFADFPLHRALGLSLVELRPGFARIALRTGPVTIGGVGASVHGGILAAMVDVAMLRALSTLFTRDDEPAGTADLNITYLRPALGDAIYAEANVLRKGRSLAVIEVAIVDGEGKLCAKGRTIYSLRDRGRR